MKPLKNIDKDILYIGNALAARIYYHGYVAMGLVEAIDPSPYHDDRFMWCCFWGEKRIRGGAKTNRQAIRALRTAFLNLPADCRPVLGVAAIPQNLVDSVT